MRAPTRVRSGIALRVAAAIAGLGLALFTLWFGVLGILIVGGSAAQLPAGRDQGGCDQFCARPEGWDDVISGIASATVGAAVVGGLLLVAAGFALWGVQGRLRLRFWVLISSTLVPAGLTLLVLLVALALAPAPT